MKVRHRYKRYLNQALSSGFIWLVFGVVYSLLEYGIMGRETIYPSTGNQYSFPNSIVFISLGSFVTGAFQGFAEAAWMGRLFKEKPLWSKVLVKGFYYLLFLIVFLSIIVIAMNAYYYGISLFDVSLWKIYLGFINRFPFWSIIIYAGLALTVVLFISEVNLYLGIGMFRNFFLGTYHRPRKEIRVFMFLDMKSSTRIAETLGHERYFEFLNMYYACMSGPIVETYGEIYQYVGDEIVVSWPRKAGLSQNNCLQCFELISRSIREQEEAFFQKFKIVPDFKAGYHIGEVTAGEIGDIKKDLIYTGDILNTAARIQAECNNYNAKVLLSGALATELTDVDNYTLVEIGQLLLRGKQESIQLFKWEI